MTLEEGTAWYERHSPVEQEVWFALYEKATWRPIGTTGLFDLDLQNRRAEFGVIIGEVDCRGKGYGTETTRLMLDYAFTVLGLHNVMLTVNSYNQAGLHAFAQAGFREFGRRRECRFMDGRLWNLVYMDCLATDFGGSILGRIFGSVVLAAGASGASQLAGSGTAVYGG